MAVQSNSCIFCEMGGDALPDVIKERQVRRAAISIGGSYIPNAK